MGVSSIGSHVRVRVHAHIMYRGGEVIAHALSSRNDKKADVASESYNVYWYAELCMNESEPVCIIPCDDIVC